MAALRPSQAPEAARALALAFQDDPVMSWCFPNPGRRRRILGAGFFMFVREVWLPGGESFSDRDVTGAACWLAPGNWHLPPRRQLGMLPSLARIARARTPRFLRLMALVEGKHPGERDHWYLPALGVRPERQGQGLGSKLMFPILSRCDSEGLPAYLEASSPRNRALYERHGFEVREEVSLPRGGPPLWLMWREPEPAPAPTAPAPASPADGAG
ncbi:MAG TPA: GNAT family N-acetyltransferase [Thermoleophilaceae bacterium]|nr:GNAT family N-acetyltransferase [Thermoleophilaceae bacterium]